VSNYIEIKGARVHNLKSVDLKIPRDKFIVVTGLSGSGKSSLAFDTLYAEGQRRYVESLSSYARQFLGRMDKPEVDYIHGIPPAVAIEQKVSTRNPRSTVGTSTEIYDYLKLLYSRIGKTYSPISGSEVKRHQTEDVVNYIFSLPVDQTIIISSPLNFPEDKTSTEYLTTISKQGFARIKIGEEFLRIKDVIKEAPETLSVKNALLVIDRFRVNKDDQDLQSRASDSVETAFFEGDGVCIIEVDNKIVEFSNKFEADGIEFEEPTVHTFSFNNPLGACPKCEGFGRVIGIDEDLVIPNKSLSIYEDAVACWRGEKMQKWKMELITNADKFDFPIHKPYFQLSEEQKRLLWTGNRYFYGLNDFFEYLESKQYKVQFRVMLSRYRGKAICPLCGGTRLKKEAGYVKIGGKAIQDLVEMPINELIAFFDKLELSSYEEKVAQRLLPDIKNRLNFLKNVGLSYLTLNRLSNTLSGGELQRINLATALGSSLVGSLYILDEPSIGLHSRDTHLLIKVLKQLRDIGNTVIVVEHEEDIIKSADQIIDIGPMAGRNGGELVFQGSQEELITANTLTAQYITERKMIPIPAIRRRWNSYIEILGARENNLKNIDVKIPLNIMNVITGVSGSGKSTLVKSILTPALRKHYGDYSDKSGDFFSLGGDLHLLKKVEIIDQNPIGKSSRSNPVTYIKAWDDIRKLFADQKQAQYNGFKPAHFSFNVPGGRCEECQGEGIIKVEMQFMADVYLQCEHCKGQRFKDEILEVKYKEKNIHDVLEMTVNEAIEFFSQGNSNVEKKIVSKLRCLVDTGLGYVKLGQASSTLSGGESQRIKLAYFLSKETPEPTIFIFDEPTTGLHFHDIHKLMDSFNSLISRGHTLLIIEHNLDIIKNADHIIDLGPEGGRDGGYIVFEGKPEDLVNCDKSYTGKYLAGKL
jgi:excinuclease ABC subunit A